MTTELQNLQINNVAEIQIMYSTKYKSSEMPKIERSKEAYDVLINFWPVERLEYQEDFYILILNRANKVIGLCHISKGGTTATVVDLKIVFSVALKANAQALIFAHNHPSGNLNPSKADIDLTRRAREVALLLDMQILDHIIISQSGFHSMADSGDL